MNFENMKRLCFVLTEILKSPRPLTAEEIERIWKQYDEQL